MSRIERYRQINRLIANETFEPMLGWGLRMAISAIAPLLWGTLTDHVMDAIWIALASEAVCWVELKGSYAWRLRTLTGAAALATIFATLGSITGSSIWLSTLCMLFVGFFATLLKSIGDRASGLAVCVYLMFILTNAYPTTVVEANAHTVITVAAMEHRILLILAGAAWTMLAGMAITVFMPVEQPFRRQVALIWRSVGKLIETIAKGWDNNDPRSNVRMMYEKEKDVRTAIDNSFQFYEQMVHQVNRNEPQQYQLAQLRKNASIVAVLTTAMSEEMESMQLKEINNPFRVKVGTFLKALQDTVERMAVFMITLEPEEKLILASRINRLKKLATLIKQQPESDNPEQKKSAIRLIHLSERVIKLLESAMGRIEKMGKEKSVFRSYSFIKTLYILNPKQIISYLKALLNFDTFNARYALRSAIAAAIALFIYKWYRIDHGYWLPFSVMIVIQPYFGATFKKALERVGGTLIGGLAGGLLLRAPLSPFVKEALLFVTFIMMVYYLRKNYAIAVFAITINLVFLFNMEAAVHPALIITRALCTIGGAGLAVIAGFLLLPTWDRKWLPKHLATAINCNYDYFVATFFSDKAIKNWTRNKRSAEKNNSNVFDSFNRYMQEPAGSSKSNLYYETITHNVRITRNLNNIHTEQDSKQGAILPATAMQQQRINECLIWFNKAVQIARQLHPDVQGISREVEQGYVTPFQLNENQQIYLEKILIELKGMEQDMEELYDVHHAE